MSSRIGITITQNAWKKMTNILQHSKNNLGFLFSVSSGGCSGFNFQLDLLDKETFNEIDPKNPMILQDNKTMVYVEPLSEMYLMGTTIDYIKEDYTKGQFENKFVFNVDKERASSCGCGISFNPK